MLRFYIGENQDAKLEVMAYSMLRDLDAGREVLAIFPDQFSFDYEKSLYAILGPKRFNKVTVLSFNRLSRELLEKYGSKDGSAMDNATRLSIIWLAVRKVKKQGELRVLSNSLEKPNFVRDMLENFDGMKRSAITPEMLMTSSKKLEGTLSDKLHDLSLLLAAYNEELTLRRRRDDSSLIVEGAAIADREREFKCKAVYIDRFDYLSPDVLMLVRVLMRDAHAVNIALMLPNRADKSISSPYRLTTSTLNKLLSVAEEVSSPIEYITQKNEKWSADGIDAVKSNIFTHNSPKPNADNSVRIYSCDTMYSEADFVCAAIRDLVRRGCKYNDICIFTHDVKTYGKILEGSFAKYGVPYYLDSNNTAVNMSLTIYALSALEAAATRKPSTEKILRLVRSPFSPLTEEEVSLIEDYTVRWNVEGDMWLEEFTARDNKYTPLEEINCVRLKIVEPLEEFRQSVKSATATEISAAFAKYLNAVEITEGAKKLIDLAPENDKVELSRLLRRLWKTLIDSVTSISRVLEDEKLTVTAYTELLRLILGDCTLSSPPQKLDSVTVADVSRSIVTHPKIGFVMGMNDGRFPGDVKKSGLFSGKDMARLEAEGIAFRPTLEATMDTERLDCHKALSAPTDLLILTYSGCDAKGSALRPSTYISRIAKLLDIDIRKASDLPAEFYCSYPTAAFNRYALGESMTPSQRISVYDALVSIPEFERKIRALERIGSYSQHKLSGEVAEKLFAKGDVNVTATRIDTYFKCNFQYFCKYGLEINEIKPMNMDANVRGTVMHFIFEAVLRYYGDGFEKCDDGELQLLIDRLLEEYIQKELSGEFGKTAKFKADYARLNAVCFDILKNIREEYKVSKFRPVRFEYKLISDDKNSILSIPINDRMSVSIGGTVDRVDMYTDPNGTKYLRIIDYKTGTKKLYFEEIYHGLNLQMLLYMLALTEGKDTHFNDCRPAGALYMHSGFFDCKGEYDPLSPETKSRLSAIDSQLKRNGIIIDNVELITAMDSEQSSRFVPIKFNKDGSIDKRCEVYSEETLISLERYAKQKVYEFGKGLVSGSISAVPLGRGERDLPCRYCEYKSVCDRKKYLMRTVKSEDRDSLFEIIGGDTDA